MVYFVAEYEDICIDVAPRKVFVTTFIYTIQYNVSSRVPPDKGSYVLLQQTTNRQAVW